MKSFRENPDGEENQRATKQSEREVFALKMQSAMKRAYFTFGQNHVHSVNGVTFDKDCVVCIDSFDPRQTMFETFGTKWAMQYDEMPDMRLYPRGVFEL